MKSGIDRTNRFQIAVILLLTLALSSCVPTITMRTEDRSVPDKYVNGMDTMNSARIDWQDFFNDPFLSALIDTALKNNQELNITIQEITRAKNEVRARKGEYLPFIDVKAGAEVEKVSRYTRNGAVEANTEILPEEEFPEPLPDFMIAATATWELDVWKKLRNAKKVAMYEYLASSEGRNFMITNLVAEIANSYYELLALDNQLDNVKQTIDIQQKALSIVKLQKQAAKTTELAVRKFEAEVLMNKSRQFEIEQDIIEVENRINFLVGRFPQSVDRDPLSFDRLALDTIHSGLPSQLLENRPDIRQAELELEAAKLDIKVAKANFYPTIGIKAGIGYQAFRTEFLFQSPEALVYSLAGDLLVPLVNRNAIKAQYYNANARQVQAAYEYERTILAAYIEVANQISRIGNLKRSYDLKEQQVEALTESINIANDLFRSARADYMEVLLTQRDALEARMELIETKKQQLNSRVNIYQALGGGWN